MTRCETLEARSVVCRRPLTKRRKIPRNLVKLLLSETMSLLHKTTRCSSKMSSGVNSSRVALNMYLELV